MGVSVTPPVPEYVPDFRPTHVVPPDGLPAWEAPDPALPTVPLDALLPVQLVARVGDWGQVLCSNGWTAWVDARLLVSVPLDPPEARQPLARTADPRPLLARAEESLGRFRRAAEELAAGRIDGEAFRRRTHGLRVGMVVDGESLWLYDAEHERWVYCDGTGIRTYAASAAPSAASPVVRDEGAAAGASIAAPDAAPDARPDSAPDAPHEPTRVVPQLGQKGGQKGGPGAPEGPPPTQVVERFDVPGES